ncbi:HNH endonuclease [Orrella dioscoreae]|uniref:HNH endonuclease n=1 Tax=Orrella dioscoreae TaxID=1851544 RepID=UPI00082C9FBB|nr:HNH endonuclease [Orrella dioscoreae]
MTREELVAALIYEPETGKLFRRLKDGSTGKQVGQRKDRFGRLCFRLRGEEVRVHRAAFLHFHGWLPKLIDHINGDASDNRIANLRAASISQNAMNRVRRSDNGGRFKGVYRDSRRGKFFARITVQGRRRVIGGFDSDVEAAFRYDVESLELHGPYGRRNFLPLVQ